MNELTKNVLVMLCSVICALVAVKGSVRLTKKDVKDTKAEGILGITVKATIMATVTATRVNNSIAQLQNELNNQGAKLLVDGFYGPKTLLACPILKFGVQVNITKWLQKRLALKLQDGLFGNGTNTAVRNYQTALRLGVDGIVGQGYWSDALLIIILGTVLGVLYKRGKTDLVKDIIYSLVVKAQKELGSTTGSAKYSQVISELCGKLPVILRLLFTKTELNKHIEASVKWLRSRLEDPNVTLLSSA